jgi:hypothetical protein
LADIRYNSTSEIKEEELEMSQSVLNIITEYPEEEHIAQKVKPSAVEEKGGEEGCEEGEPGVNIGMEEA